MNLSEDQLITILENIVIQQSNAAVTAPNLAPLPNQIMNP